MKPGERWTTRGLFGDEPEVVVTVIEDDPEAVCVDVRYDDGSERLLPRSCLLRKVEPI